MSNSSDIYSKSRITDAAISIEKSPANGDRHGMVLIDRGESLKDLR
jgi:hypothetical protein